MRQAVLRKKSFIPALAEQTGLTEEQAEKFYQIVFESIKWALSRGYSVNIENFGTFKPKYLAERTWTHNVENKDGEFVRTAPEHIKIQFKAHKPLQDFVSERVFDMLKKAREREKEKK